MLLQPRADNGAYGGRGPLLLGVSWTLCLIAILLVGLRAYGASQRAGRLRWDFIFVAVGTLCGLVSQTLFIFACLNGVGDHVVNLSFPQLFAALKYSWISLMIGLVGTTVAKCGIAAMLLQVALPGQTKRRVFLWAVGVTICAVGVAQMAVSLSQCEPYDRLWYRAKPGNCDRTVFAARFGYFQGATAIVADLILALYPITIVWNLQASLRVKVGFCVLMAGGVIAAAACIIRTYYLKRLEDPKDFTWEFVPFFLWAAVELWFVVILGSIPPLRPLFLLWFGKARTHFGESTRGATHGSARGGGTLDSHSRGGFQLQNVSGVGSGKRGFSSRVMSKAENSSSEEDILQAARKEHGEAIVVSKEYTVAVERVMPSLPVGRRL